MAEQQKATPPGPKASTGGQKLVPNVLAASPAADASGQSEAHKVLSVRVDRIYRTIEAQAEEARQAKSDTAKQLADITSALANITSIVQASMPNQAGGSSGMPVVDPSSARVFSGAAGQMPILSPQSEDRSHPPSTGDSQMRFQPQVARKLHDLPSFSGAPEDWPRFYAMYQQSTEAYGYSALDNSIRLQRCLVGEAKNAVDCLMFDVDATSKVIEALRFRFGRPELLAQAQLRRVREIPPIPEAKAELIVPFASKVANMIAYLNQPKTKQYLMNPELLEQLVQKLPMSRRHEWGRHAVNIDPCATVSDFSKWLDDLARCVSYMTPAATLASATQPQLQQHQISSRQQSVAQSSARPRDRLMHVHQHNQQQCGWCDGSHNTEDCRRFAELDVSERWRAVRSENLCFSCMQKGHIKAQCNPRSRCGQDGCDRPHHKMLHDSQLGRNNIRRSDDMQGDMEQSSSDRAENRSQLSATYSRRNPFDREQQSVEQSTSGTNNDRVHTCWSIESESRHVLLRILPVVLRSPNQREERTYALLDEASSVTMLDKAMAEKLGLDGPTTTVDLQWVGGRCSSKESRNVSLGISGVENGHAQFELNNVRTVTNFDLPLQSMSFSDLANHYKRLRGLPIRDYQNAVPTILIGADNIHLGVAMRQISGASPGPVATETRLGWVICGPRMATPTNLTVQLANVEANADSKEIQEAVEEQFSPENPDVRHCEVPLESRSVMKLLSQNVWRHGTYWEKQIPPDIDRELHQWVAKSVTCRQMCVSSCYHPSIRGSHVELLVFADVSRPEYWRNQIAPADWRVFIVAGEARCALQKFMSAPRFELQAVILAFRLLCRDRAMHNIDVKRDIWSDSTMRADTWPFGEIIGESTIADWCGVPRQRSSANNAKRAIYPDRFEATNLRIGGTELLQLNETLRPAEPADMRWTMGTEEVRPLSVHHVSTNLNLALVSEQIIRFSNFYRSCRAMVMVLRFAKNLGTTTWTNGEIRSSELADAERNSARLAQWIEYSEEIGALRQGEALCSTIRALLPSLDQNGLLRMTRIDQAICGPEYERNSVIVQRNHHLTKIIVATNHFRSRHQQQAVRRNYWVPHKRAFARQVNSARMFCCIGSAHAFELVMYQLSADRVMPFVRPLTYKGVDNFGPLLVYIGRKRKKRWIAQATCMIKRAIHLELTSHFITDAFLIFILNLMNLRGVLKGCDGSNFLRVTQEQEDAIDRLDHPVLCCSYVTSFTSAGSGDEFEFWKWS